MFLSAYIIAKIFSKRECDFHIAAKLYFIAKTQKRRVLFEPSAKKLCCLYEIEPCFEKP